MITQDLGIATAYGYAKSKGYTGTEAEFAELMASYASTAQTAIEAADRAVEANTAAQSAKTDAQASKTAAQTAAQTATSKASEASQSASTATTKASEASQSATSANHSAESASTSAYTATAKAGTATAKADAAAASEAAALSAKTDAESARDAAAQSASEAAASAESIDPETLEHKAYGAYVVESASGAIASFTDGADDIPMKDVLVHIEPVQAGSGNPSPDNVRAITGWTGAKVTRCGKNLFDEEFEIGGISSSDGSEYSSNNTLRTKNYISVIPGEKYYFLCPVNVTRCFYDKDRQWISTGYSGNVEITAPANAHYFKFSLQTLYGITYNHDIAVNYPSTATDYEPYSGQTYSITFPTEAGTVYGGTLDVTSGVLTVTHKMYTFNGSENWTAGNYGYRYEYNLEGLPDYIKTWNSGGRGLSNFGIYDATAYTNNVNYITSRVAVVASNTGAKTHVLVVPASIATTVEELKAFLANTPEQWYAPLQTPITYQLTPQEIASLLGTNNLRADTGDSEVEYRADTKMYIAKKITEAVSALS